MNEIKTVANNRAINTLIVLSLFSLFGAACQKDKPAKAPDETPPKPVAKAFEVKKTTTPTPDAVAKPPADATKPSANAVKDDLKIDPKTGKKLPAASTKVASSTDSGPRDAVKRYLNAGAKGRTADVKKLVDPKCHKNKSIMTVSALKMMGMRINVKRISASELKRDGSKASVKASIGGTLKGNTSGTKSLFGKKVKFNVKNVKASNVNVSRNFDVAKVGSSWKVSCP